MNSTERNPSNTTLATMMAWLIFPVTLFGLLTLSYVLYQLSVDPALIIAGASISTLSIIAIAERLMPFRDDWNRNHGDIATDICHNLLSSFSSREIYKLIFIALLAPVVMALSSNVHSSDGQSSLWGQYLADLPLVLQLFVLAAIAEFGNYWVHRASHETDWLWRFHAVHHSPKRLYWLNAGRDHPVSVFFFYIAASVPLILLGAGKDVLLLYYVMEAVHGLFQHCNIRLRLGPLNWLFSMAELHRWHHSVKIKEANANYGLTLIIWDVVFGTRYLPDSNGPDHIGIHQSDFPTRFWQQMQIPFKWSSLQASEADKESATDNSAS